MKHLTQEQVAELADKYGFAVNDKNVIENAQQADDAHGKNIGKVSWSTDYRGIVDAYKLLDGLLDQVVQEMNYNAKSHDDFVRDAYGD